MFKFDDITKERITAHNPIWPEIPDHPYRILKLGGSVSGKTNALLNVINHEPGTDNIYLYWNDPYEAKYQLSTIKRESTALKFLNDPKPFIEHSHGMNDVYKNIEEYNPNNKLETLIVFDDIIVDMPSNEKLDQIVFESFIRGRKLNISHVLLHNLVLLFRKILN